MKKYDYSILETLRLEIAATIFESQVLFEKLFNAKNKLMLKPFRELVLSFVLPQGKSVMILKSYLMR